MGKDINIEQFMSEFLNRKVVLSKLYREYSDILSEDIRDSIISYERLPGDIVLPKRANRDTAIKLNLENGEWIKIYKIDEKIECD